MTLSLPVVILPLLNLMQTGSGSAGSFSVLPIIPPETTGISWFDRGQEYNTDQWIILHPVRLHQITCLLLTYPLHSSLSIT
jgi:hypothetical protein